MTTTKYRQANYVRTQTQMMTMNAAHGPHANTTVTQERMNTLHPTVRKQQSPTDTRDASFDTIALSHPKSSRETPTCRSAQHQTHQPYHQTNMSKETIMLETLLPCQSHRIQPDSIFKMSMASPWPCLGHGTQHVWISAICKLIWD